MPIYEFFCYNDYVKKEELRSLGDSEPPKCPVCGKPMDRIFSVGAAIFKGRDEARRVSEKLKKRSEEQGKKFFKKYPEYQDLVSKTLADKGKET